MFVLNKPMPKISIKTIFKDEIPQTLYHQYITLLWSYLFSPEVYVTVFSDSQTVILSRCLHIYLPSPQRSTGPRGHTVKHFLTQSQDSWQIPFFLLTRKRITSNLLIQLQECTPGFSRNKAVWWNQQKLLLLVCRNL